jgi:hypothetical protein
MVHLLNGEVQPEGSCEACRHLPASAFKEKRLTEVGELCPNAYRRRHVGLGSAAENACARRAAWWQRGYNQSWGIRNEDADFRTRCQG